MYSLCHFSFRVFRGMDDCVSHRQPTFVVVVVDHHSKNTNRKWSKNGERTQEEKKKKKTKKIMNATYRKTMLSLWLDIHTMCFFPHSPALLAASLSQHGVITFSDIYVFWFVGARFIFHCWISFLLFVVSLIIHLLLLLLLLPLLKMMKIKPKKPEINGVVVEANQEKNWNEKTEKTTT